ncbi:hypothetical protein R0J90_12410, partial [Micrococcus sp. SIMBA_144]
MEINELLNYQWSSMMPEFTILLTAVTLSLLDLFMPKNRDRAILVWFALAGIAMAIVFLIFQLDDGV